MSRRTGKSRSGMHDSRTTGLYSRGKSEARYAKMARSRMIHHRVANVFKVLGISVVAVLAVFVIYAGVIQGKLGFGLDSDLFAALTKVNRGDPFYALLLGIDKDQERANSKAFGPSDAAYRADSLMLARIDPKQDQVTLISIHRDTMIDMGKYGKQKIGAAVALGGPAYAVKVVSEYAGVPIAHYAEMDFEGFTQIVDTLGGVEVNVPIDINDNMAKAHLKAGTQTLNGEQALALSRARHAYDSYGPGDAYRAANQRMILSAIAKKLLSSNLAVMTASITQLADCVRTDMSLQDILAVATDLHDMDVENNIFTGQDPTTSAYINNVWYEICDTDKWKTMMERVDAGLSPYSSVDEDPTHGAAGGKVNIKNTDGNSGSSQQNGSNNSGSTSNDSLSGNVRVLNATSVAGLAAKIADDLKAAGASTSAGNANNKYDETVIAYMNSKSKQLAEDIAKKLGHNTKVQNGEGVYTSSQNADVLIIVGNDLKDY